MNNQLAVIETNLQGLLTKKQSALPENFNQTRFLQNCIYALADVKDLGKMEPMSIALTMLKGAFLGLDFFNKECYAIPYGNKLQFQTDYKGEVKLAKLYSMNPIKNIYCKLIREGDHYQVTMKNGEQQVEYSPLPFNQEKIIGVFGVVIYEDGGFYVDDMSVDEVEIIRRTYSKAPDSKMWKFSYGEAVKKTMSRRLTKTISLEFKNSEQDTSYKDGADVEFDNFEEVKPEVKMPKKKAPPFEKMKKAITDGKIKQVQDSMDKWDWPDDQKNELEALIVEALAPEQTDPPTPERMTEQRIDQIMTWANNYKMNISEMTGSPELKTRSDLIALDAAALDRVYNHIKEQVE